MNRKTIAVVVVVSIVVGVIGMKVSNKRKYVNASHLFEPKVKITNEVNDVSELFTEI